MSCGGEELFMAVIVLVYRLFREVSSCWVFRERRRRLRYVRYEGFFFS